jgi:hypothetical protein
MNKRAPAKQAWDGGSGEVLHARTVLWCAIAFLTVGFLAPWPSRADDLRLMSVGIRGGVTVGLPWGWYSRSGWGVGTRLIGSAGVIQETGSSGLIGSLVPVLAFGSQDGRYAVDIGFGGALLSTHHFGKQNFGGPFQIVATVGISVPLYERFGVGYRFQHYSDAGLYGTDSRGADFHMIELTYRY